MVKLVSVEAKQIEGFKIEAKARDHVAIIDQPPAGGGNDAGPTPLEYQYFSLASCIITIGHIIAKQKHLPVRGIEVKIEGELDTDVFMGKNNNGARAGFTGIRVYTKIDADMTQAEKEQFLHDVDVRCPISDNVKNQTPVQFFVE